MKIKKIFRLLVTLIILLLIALGVVLFYIDHITKVAIEKTGTKALTVKTTLEKADLSLIGAALELDQLRLANPPGYQTDSLLDIGNFAASLNVGSLTSETIEIKQVRFDNLIITIEQKGLTNNVDELLKAIQAQQKQPTDKAPPEKGVASKKITIKRIDIPNATLRVKMIPIPGQLDVIKVKLAPLTLENIGTDNNKTMMAADVFRQTLLAVLNAVIETGTKDLPQQMQKILGQTLGSVNQVLESVTGGVLKQTEQLLKEGENILKSSEKALEETGKGLLDLPGKLLTPKNNNQKPDNDTKK